jgi:hypothetical protein
MEAAVDRVGELSKDIAGLQLKERELVGKIAKRKGQLEVSAHQDQSCLVR